MQTQNFAEQIQEEFLFYEQKPEAKFEANLGIGLSSWGSQGVPSDSQMDSILSSTNRKSEHCTVMFKCAEFVVTILIRQIRVRNQQSFILP